MKFNKISMLAPAVGLILSACGGVDSDSVLNFTCDVTKNSDSAELKMVYGEDTYTYSGKIDEKNVIYKSEYVFSSAENAKKMCTDTKNEGVYENVECSDKKVTFSNTKEESNPSVSRIVKELENECALLEEKYGYEEIYNDDDEEEEEDYGYYEDE